MSRTLESMSREELVRALPKRLLVMVVFLAFVFASVTSLASIVIQMQMALPWMVALLAAVLGAPFGISRMFRWTLAPAHERMRRRKSMMREALASVTWSGGDYEV